MWRWEYTNSLHGDCGAWLGMSSPKKESSHPLPHSSAMTGACSGLQQELLATGGPLKPQNWLAEGRSWFWALRKPQTVRWTDPWGIQLLDFPNSQGLLLRAPPCSAQTWGCRRWRGWMGVSLSPSSPGKAGHSMRHTKGGALSRSILPLPPGNGLDLRPPGPNGSPQCLCQPPGPDCLEGTTPTGSP